LSGSSTPFPLVRTYFSLARRVSHFILLNILNLVGLILGIVGFSTQNKIIVAASIASLIVGVMGITTDYFKWRRGIEDLNVHRLPPLRQREMNRLVVPPRLAESNYQIFARKDSPLDSLLTSEDVNQALFCGANAELVVSSTGFKNKHSSVVSHVLLREFTQKKAVLFNAAKVRMLTDPTILSPGVLRPVHVGMTHYYETLVTNDAVSLELVSHTSRNTVFNGRDFCFPKHAIPPCGQSACSNQVGASTLAVTSDGYLVIAEQGRRSAIGKGLLAASGSGSADWKDVGAFTTLQEFVMNFAMRELIEECGLSASDVEWMRIIGYGRLLDRGGLPQFFCLARLNCAFDKVNITRSERALTGYHDQIDLYGDRHSTYSAIQGAVQILLKEKHKVFSSLWWALELLARVPEDRIESAFNHPG
jgi:hypothetical protein